MTTHRSRGREPAGRLGRRVVGGEAGVGERGDVGGLQRRRRSSPRCGPRSCRYSAYPPLVSMPGNALASQCTSSPERQARHSPQVISGCTITLSPSATLVTAEPTACTQPAFSWPIVYGSCDPDFSAHWPSRMCRSVRHTPGAADLARRRRTARSARVPAPRSSRGSGGSRRPGRLASCSSGAPSFGLQVSADG